MQTEKRCASCGVALIALLAFAVGVRGAAQSSNGVSSPALPVVDSSWPVVNLNVAVLDKDGAPRKIDEREFQLFEDGAARPLQFRDSPDSQVSLALVIDSSGSLFKRKQEMISAVTAIIKSMPADSEVMAVLFANQAYLDLPFTPVPKVDFSFLDRLQDSGPTALYDAVFATEDYILAHAKYPRRSLVILSDGEDNASHVSRRTIFWKMHQPGAPMVYACLDSRAWFMQNELVAGHMNLKFLAKEGGGTHFNLDPDPTSAAAQIVAAVRSQYVLEFTAANPARDGKAHKLDVRLPVKDVQIHALPVYHSPAK